MFPCTTITAGSRKGFTKDIDLARTRTWNLLLRRQTRYPLRHKTGVRQSGNIFENFFFEYSFLNFWARSFSVKHLTWVCIIMNTTVLPSAAKGVTFFGKRLKTHQSPRSMINRLSSELIKMKSFGDSLLILTQKDKHRVRPSGSRNGFKFGTCLWANYSLCIANYWILWAPWFDMLNHRYGHVRATLFKRKGYFNRFSNFSIRNAIGKLADLDPSIIYWHNWLSRDLAGLTMQNFNSISLRDDFSSRVSGIRCT